MTISFKDTLGTVGIDWDSLQEGNDYQRMGDANTDAHSPLVVGGTLTVDRNLTLQYPPNAASQSSFSGVTVVVVNGSPANNIVVERATGGGSTVNVPPGQTGWFMLPGDGLIYSNIYLA